MSDNAPSYAAEATAQFLESPGLPLPFAPNQGKTHKDSSIL